MSNPDYWFKSIVLSEHADVVQLQRIHSKIHYLESIGVPVDPELKEAVSYTVSSFFGKSIGLNAVWREAERINHAYYVRAKRLKYRISALLHTGQAYFLTLTFSDSILESTSAQTRRRYVTRFLKSLSNSYVANIDFGSKNGREHYHAVVLADVVDMSAWDRYGFSNAKKIRSDEDCAPLAKYISKLTNHALKATNQSCRAIYSS